MINNDTFIQTAHTLSLLSIGQKNITMLNDNETNTHQESMKKCTIESDKALEIQQIECEQRLVVEQMIYLKLQKERLQNLLHVLHTLDSDDDEQNE